MEDIAKYIHDIHGKNQIKDCENCDMIEAVKRTTESIEPGKSSGGPGLNDTDEIKRRAEEGDAEYQFILAECMILACLNL